MITNREISMKYYIEQDKNAFSYYGDLIEDENYSLSTLSLNGRMDVDSFIKQVTRDVLGLLKSLKTLSNFSIYICTPKRIMNRNSKVEMFKKVWKSLPDDYPAEYVIKGDEVEFASGQAIYYASIGKIDIKGLEKVIKFVSKFPTNYFLFISNDEGLLQAEHVESIFSNEDKLVDFSFSIMTIDALSKRRCNKGDIVLRWGTSSEEHCLGLIYDKTKHEIIPPSA